ncbi:MAG TPA: monovalent cation/H(+) antiporter subunit G [Bryobacteraceae bacterium]|nr:monovalent cation/H(+) antiporter subunit G [Bryobacteraceae bacterium]HOQ46976.1 monovalent cation/H(+) antiporter subunit G [Bryobacteraceae bacterium]HPQ16906.1 monovalent cation/H(+) antiporter subunit G [Bryobacteraceae bacterium]HPU73097.1 monovalent cation/H(+) antiporter subunit G [Bryobacteraceae bacterium]
MSSVIAGFFLLVGAAFMLLAALGVLRMPDLFMRMQATSKATTLGVGCLMLGVAIHFGDLGTVLRACAIVALFFVTAPIAAHVIARAAYFLGAVMWNQTIIDELRGRYDERSHRLKSDPGGSS